MFRDIKTNQREIKRGDGRMNILEFYGMLFLVGFIIDHSINIYLLKKKVRELKQTQKVFEE